MTDAALPSFEVVPSGGALGAELRGLDLSKPLDADTFAAVDAAFNRHSVVCFPCQILTEPQYIAFARRFGEVEEVFLNSYAHPQYPEVFLVSNIQEGGRDIGHADAGAVWHTDMSYTARPPRATLLYAIEVPREGGVALGDTVFASAEAAYDALPEAMKARLEGLRAIHNVFGRRGDNKGIREADQKARLNQPDVVHPVVRTHPFTGRRGIYVSQGECIGIEGMDNDEALALIADLAALVQRSENRYTHKWRVGDVLIWDNCAVQHLATFDYQWPRHRRLMHRITVGGDVPI